MSVYASDRILNSFQQNENQSDLAQSIVTTMLQLMSAGGLVADSANPAAACISWADTNLQHNAATLVFSQQLQTMSQAYSQRGQ
jgi:hypothetical protein